MANESDLITKIRDLEKRITSVEEQQEIHQDVLSKITDHLGKLWKRIYNIEKSDILEEQCL